MFTAFRSKVAVLPMGAGFAGVVVVAGTVIGQAGHAAGAADPNPMAGMNMSGGTMPGMSMPGNSKDAAPTSSAQGVTPAASMPGMDMSDPSKKMSGMDMTDPKMAGMDMGKSGATTMDMTDPNMAASMPGGLHKTCKADTCTVVFADTATGIAKVLGTTAHLEHAAGKTVTLTVGGRKLTLQKGKAVTSGKVTVELINANAHVFTVEFRKKS